MLQDPIRTAVIIGSTREGRFGDTVARWFVARASQRSDIEIDLIDLAEVELPAIMTEITPPQVQEMVDRIAARCVRHHHA